MSNENVRNFRLSQSWVEDQVNLIKKDYNYEKNSKAFQALVYGVLFETDYSIPAEEDLDGSGEKQIDIIRVEEDPDQEQATINIVQSKYTNGFSSNVISLLKNGLEWIFEQPEKEYKKLKNKKFVFKIGEIRKLRTKYGHEGLKVNIYFATKGDTGILNEESSHEYLEEKEKFLSGLVDAFNEFNFHEIGSIELTELIGLTTRSKRNVDTDIQIVYDTNVRSIIDIKPQGTSSRAVVCTVRGNELARLANLEPKDAIFDLNVRPYYGSRGQVNSKIYETCQNDEQSKYFWFLNNGITMTCDKVDVITDPDQALVRVKNVQIVNGCQTSVSIREAAEKGVLREDVTILMRIYETVDKDLAKKITLTTNNQNKITDRDLRANDSVQYLIQTYMKDTYSYLYERKNKEHRTVSKEDRRKIIPNDKAGQAYLAIVKRKPSQARGYLSKIWSTYYKDIFESSVTEDLLLSFLIYSYFLEKSKSAKNKKISRMQAVLQVYGTFHLARITGHFLTNDKWGQQFRIYNKHHIEQIKEKGSTYLDPYFSRTINLLADIWKKELEKDKKTNPTLYFKASVVEKQIEKALGYKEDEIDE